MAETRVNERTHETFTESYLTTREQAAVEQAWAVQGWTVHARFDDPVQTVYRRRRDHVRPRGEAGTVTDG